MLIRKAAPGKHLREVAEAALADTLDDRVEAVYRRSVRKAPTVDERRSRPRQHNLQL
jgi:hypothetical protein